MIVLNGLDELTTRFARPVITIGNFDGVHLGHQALFRQALERARAIGGTSIAMTFEPHPMRVLRPAVNLPLITPLEQKTALIRELGLDVLLCVRFDENFALLSADAFVDKLLVGRLKLAEAVVGYDFTFGHKGLGDLDLLKAKGVGHGFLVHVVGPVIVDGQPVSSTRVRQEVKSCQVGRARQLLGRHYSIAGEVVTGHGRGGRLLGFPTANLRVSDELLPGPGVYATLMEIAPGRINPGVTNIGTNPTFSDAELSVETHLLDFHGDLYGHHVRLQFVEYLRGEKRFSGLDELAQQIGRDVEEGRRILASWVS
ncbi:MAG: bifunctional riboflavin kinase/FAD synthetase [Deltaproteobacteria bacterium]|nr:bifunctional riboflavin kinase/FAD synthetase [Deltaproteobacteria bacterium]